MFNSKSRSSKEMPIGANSIIGAGTVITGDIETTGDIRIDGILKGNLTGSSKILLGPEGIVEGNIQGQQADILGQVTGIIRVADLLHLRGKAIVNGDIYAGNLQVEPTVVFNGKCHMGNVQGERANIIELKAADTAMAVNL